MSLIDNTGVSTHKIHLLHIACQWQLYNCFLFYCINMFVAEGWIWALEFRLHKAETKLIVLRNGFAGWIVCRTSVDLLQIISIASHPMIVVIELSLTSEPAQSDGVALAVLVSPVTCVAEFRCACQGSVGTTRIRDLLIVDYP